jgi:succinyl-CoA synthetase alpha subunit
MSAVVRGALHRNSYRDSVELMGIAAELESLPGVARAGLVMATPANLAVLAGAGLSAAVPDGAAPSDLIVAIQAADEPAADAALAQAKRLLSAGSDAAGTDATGGGRVALPQTLDEGLAAVSGANLALISTPGTYATAEALKAIKRGLNVFLFSDNVSEADEVMLKREAARRRLLVMGPDCGTAIVAGIPLGFANAVRPGSIGVAAASGTGLQQVTCLIHRFGGGISHAIGTGGRDLHEEVGGATMRAAIERLLADEGTKVVVLISKPPAASVAEAILASIRGASKPVVVNFLGGGAGVALAAGAHPAATFEAAARMATDLAGGLPVERNGSDGLATFDPDLEAQAGAAAAGLRAGAQILGLFSGGSLAGEARLILRELLGPGRADRILDLGEDEYTVGRPHPMIDPRLRSEQIEAAGGDPGIGVVLLDIVLGYGSHPDPAGALVPAIEAARGAAVAAGRTIAFVASVCGTDLDPQGLAGQERTLIDAGVHLASSNARAAVLAGRIAALATTRTVGVDAR